MASAEDAAWNQSFFQLRFYHREHGHCHVPAHERIHRKLAAWAALQREIHQRGGMRADRQAELDALGFAWETEKKGPSQDHREAKWNQRFVELVAFQKMHGHSRVPKLPPGNKVLWHWRHVQREWRRKGILKPERIARLDAIGFEWEEPDSFGRSRDEKWESRWERMFQQLVQFKERFGHCRVVTGWKENPNLAKWVIRQRMAQRRDELRADRKARLDALGFAWQLKEGGQYADLWERRYAEMTAFKELHGHTRVTKEPPGNKVLWHWRHVQREFRRKGMLRAERIARLDAIGFEWEEPDRFGMSREEKWENLWERMFHELVQFKERFRHCRVVTDWEENPHLAKWVIRQRMARRRGELRADRKACLDALGFDWELKERGALADLWEQRYTEMVAFKEMHGHTRVPKRPPGNRVLWHWRHVQREFRRKGMLKAERIARLDAIGFEWEEPPGASRSLADYLEPLWNAKFERLRKFHERFGHTRVPKRWQEDQSLANWTMKQRQDIRRQKISAEHKARLDALGFQSGKPSARLHEESESYHGMWIARFEKLRQFQERFGHTRVPRRWREDPALGQWTSTQRRANRRNQLKPERKAQLESLGFEWHSIEALASATIYPGPRDQRVRELAAFKARFGHTRVPVRWKEDPGLGEWAAMQRHLRRKGRLNARRTAQLEALDFEWNRSPQRHPRQTGRSQTRPGED